jgi:hypothetical protein
MASLQHKHHKYNLTSKDNMGNTNNNMRMKRLMFLKRRAATHQPLNDDGDDCNQVCDPNKTVDRTEEDLANNADDESLSNIQIKYCLVNSEDSKDHHENVAAAVRCIYGCDDDNPSDVKISYSVAQAKIAPSELKSNQDLLKQPAVAAMNIAKASGTATGGVIVDDAWDREAAMELAKASSFSNCITKRPSFPTGDYDLDMAISALEMPVANRDFNTTTRQVNKPTTTPMSTSTADHVSLLALDRDSTLKERALAAMEMLKANSFFAKHDVSISPSENSYITNNGATHKSIFISENDLNLIASESLAWQVDSLKTAENSPTSEASLKDIDIVITESSEEDGTGGAGNEGKISSLLNDFSFNFKQMINNTFTSEEDSVRSDDSSQNGSLPALQDFEELNDGDSKSNDGNIVVDCNSAGGNDMVEQEKKAGDKKPAAKRFVMGIAKVVRGRTRLNRSRSDSISSTNTKNSKVSAHSMNNDADPNEMWFEMDECSLENESSSRKRSESMSSKSSISEDESFPSLNQNNTSMQSIKKLTMSIVTMSIGDKLKKLNWSRSSSVGSAHSTGDNSIPTLHDDVSVPELMDDDASVPYDDTSLDESGSFLCSPQTHLNSPTSTDEVESLGALDSSFHSSGHSDASDASGSYESDEEDIEDKDESMIHSLLASMKQLGNSINPNEEEDHQSESADLSSENVNPNVQRHSKDKATFSINNRFSPSKESLGLEMIAHPELLHKYD